ncbi:MULTISPECIES: 4-hydroxy-tetrahydrodipicolinate reductase [Prochlorococcus]|uniref:4-hydroxy-tetrahydrodipicolinate reductase n=1 Tax=Prochlorococcus TaxID=1218 RepID=UPI00053393DB|nr:MULTISPECIES: 4-hydroxy-tetrahydrodipicolinate reductase [Prochlorococcus]KGG12410.1 Dihydrodipicolinate reductase [Prochlorococcus sp. MIT 0601]
MTKTENTKIPILVAGALGKMGSEVVKTISVSEDFSLIAAIDLNRDKEGQDIGDVLKIGKLDIHLNSDFEGCLCSASQAYRDSSPLNTPVLIDFTQPSVVYEHTRAAIAYGVHPVIGTTGLTPEQIKELEIFASKASIGTAIIPNFSIGMVLLQQAASAASYFYDHAELIESHHNQKKDAPSGTCIKTAELIEESQKFFNNVSQEEEESLTGSRGGKRQSGLNIHSIRLPGLVAHQEVIFGSIGETYVLTHNTIDRKAYMPGVKIAAKKVRDLSNLVYGLEKLI